MPSTDVPSSDALARAGQRAAYRPVPPPPAVDTLMAEVGRRRTKRRRAVGGGFAALAAVVAIPFGVAALDGGEPDVVTLATDDGSAPAETSAPAAQDERETTTTVAPTEELRDDARRGPLFGPGFGEDAEFDLRLDLGEGSYAVMVTSGDEAIDLAAAAEESADETRTIDDQTVWIDDRGDRTAASALMDGTVFVEITGPTDQIESALDLLTQYAEGPLELFGHEDFELPEDFVPPDGFELPEGFLDRNGPFDPESFFDDEAFEDFPFDLEDLFDGLIEDFESTTIE